MILHDNSCKKKESESDYFQSFQLFVMMDKICCLYFVAGLFERGGGGGSQLLRRFFYFVDVISHFECKQNRFIINI